MSPDPSDVHLPYVLGNAYLETQALEGRFPDRCQRAVFEVATLPESIRKRLLAIDEQLSWPPDASSPLVLDTGVDHSPVHRAEGDRETMADPIHRELGPLPALSAPFEDPAPLLDAYERWIGRYRELAPQAVRKWVARFAQDSPLTEEQRQQGVQEHFWRLEFPLRVKVDNSVTRFVVDGRGDIDRFITARSTMLLLSAVRDEVTRESWDKALELVGEMGWIEHPQMPLSRAVDAFTHFGRRFAAVARAHHRSSTSRDRSFEETMAVWARERGSERLRLGLADGYRMTSVYIEERLAHEAPGFYAIRAAGPLLGKDRVAPSEYALKLARAVQQRLNGELGSPYRAVIRWMHVDELPKPLVDSDLDPEYVGRWEVEAIVINHWLARYHLVGIVDDPENRAPEWVRRTLDPEPYGIPGPAPPSSAFSPRDDIPF